MGKLYSGVLGSFVALLLLTCTCERSTVRLRNPYETDYDPNYGMNEDDIRTQFNLHRGRWWNYYVRGSWLLACGRYSAAREDFKIAIGKRDRDKWNARTYGMHFIGYFPHRESGIAFCLEAEKESYVVTKEKLFEQAIDKLKKSLSHEESSKAKFYLKRATAGFWKTTQADITPPVVGIANNAIDRWADVPTLYINRHKVTLEIQASDRQSGIAKVWVGDVKLFIESAQKTFTEDTVVTVDSRDKEKTVVVKAIDLAGNESLPAIVRLVVDTDPPTAAIRAYRDNAVFLDGRIPVQIAAADDQGLKSVQVGQEPYDSRDCRGQTMWEGTFYAKPGVRELSVKVADRAGNVTATTITIEPRQLVSLQRYQYQFYDWPSLRYDDRRWNGILGSTPQLGTQWSHFVQVYPAKTHSFNTHIGYSGVLRLASYQARLPVPELVFREFRRRVTVRTSHDTYVLQGQVRHAKGLEDIRIFVDDEELKSKQVKEKGDFVIFSECVPLPDYDKVRSIKVEASFQDGPPISKSNLRVERVRSCVYEPNAVYSVMLLPLKEKLTPTDPNGRHRDTEGAHDAVLEALRACRLYDPNDPSHAYPRFNCEALKMWSVAKIARELNRLGVAKDSPERKFTKLANKYRNEQELQIDLGFYGDITEDANSLEIVLGVINVKNKELLFRRIDIFGRNGDYARCTKGLISKLQTKIRRVRGKIDHRPEGGKVVIGCGSDDGVFHRMDVGFYEPRANGCFDKLGDASIMDVRRDSSAVQVSDRLEWNNIRNSWNSIDVIGK